MVYADTGFFIALMQPDDPLYQEARKIFEKYRQDLETSLLALAELLVGCEKEKADPERVVGALFRLARVSGISLEEGLRAAHYMKTKRMRAIDALHAALSGFEIISPDTDFDKADVKRIWVRGDERKVA